MALSFGAGLYIVRRGPGGSPGALATQRGAVSPSALTPAHCPCAACSGRNTYAGPIARPLSCPALGPARPWLGLRSGCGCRFASPLRRATGRPACCLACRARSRPSLGARRPPAPLAAPVGGSGPGPVGSRCGCALALLRRGLCLAAPACLAAGLLPPCRRRPGGRLPPAGLVSLAPPAGGRGGCGAAVRRPCSASPPPRARRAWVPLRRELLTMVGLRVDILLCYDYESSTTVRRKESVYAESGNFCGGPYERCARS